MNIITSRKAVKVFQKNHLIPQNVLSQILSDTMRAPSSFNLQPWHFFVIINQAAKNKLKPCLYGNEPQLETSSALILVCGNSLKNETKEPILRQSFAAKQIPMEFQNQILAQIDLLYKQKSSEEITNEIFLECGIVSLQLMLAAKSHGYDTCPMGGFNHRTIKEALGIAKNYVPALLIAIGKSDPTKPLLPSFRLPFDKVTTYL
ncbi:nitroreductase family protein [Candidatus Phytoplasma solani]|uniref:nitroreductase family protein n=1 Tax=Candidatus Phytoplasma solani TaxID=69896 RepID=UPI00358E4130